MEQQEVEHSRVIPGYEKYTVDKTGIVYGRYQRPITPRKRNNGQVCVDLYTKDGSRISVSLSRCVALAFLGVPEEGMRAIHIDGDANNNTLENIRWGTQKEVMQNASKLGKLSGPKVRKLKFDKPAN